MTSSLPSMRLRNGVCLALEEAANELIFGSLKDVTSHAAKSDILTPWKERDRRDREVMAAAGVVDQAVRKGMYHRRMNDTQTHLNSREGWAPPTRWTKSANCDPERDFAGGAEDD